VDLFSIACCRMCGWQIIFCFEMVIFNGIYIYILISNVVYIKKAQCRRFFFFSVSSGGVYRRVSARIWFWVVGFICCLICSLFSQFELGSLFVLGEIRMERRFKVEAKTFFFSTKDAKLCLEERRKGFLGLILVGHRSASWLVATVEEVSLSPVLEDFVKSSSEGRMFLSVRGGCNEAGRFLEVAAFVDDEWKGIIWIPEARSRRGWQRFVVELRLVLAGVDSFPRCSSEGSKGIENGRSFADALRSPFCEVEDSAGLQIFSSQEIDLFPVASSYELGFDGKEERSAWDRSAWDCYEMECAFPTSLPMKVAAKDRRKKKKCLGLIGEKLDRILSKLGLTVLDYGSDSGSVSGSDAGSDSRPILSWLDSRSDSGSALSFTGELVSATMVFIPVSSPLVKEVVLEPPSRSPLSQNVEDWPASSTGSVFGSAASAGSGSTTLVGLGLATPKGSRSTTPAGLGLAKLVGSRSATSVSFPVIPSSLEALPGSAMLLVSEPAKASDLVPVFGFVPNPDSVSASGLALHPLVVPIPEALDSILSIGLVSRSAMLAESSPFL
jgi:hypothetical protein